MSALGQSRHFDRAPLASGLPPTPDILSAPSVCLKGANNGSARLFDHFVGALLEMERHVQSERLGGL
jgi:hypothetical protein